MVPYKIVTIDTSEISNWNTFHTVFATNLGFPDFYGRNMAAWIDCMTDVDDPKTGMTTVQAPPNGILVLHLEGMRGLRRRCPDLAEAIDDCAAFVNFRRIEVGDSPVLALSVDDFS